MAENRLNRDSELRTTKNHKPRWRQPDLLPKPNERPGWEHRWIRVASYGQPDPTNISQKLREGWVPCKAADYTEIDMTYVESERFKDNIVFGGLMLCKAPTEMVTERTEHYTDQNRVQIQGVDNHFLSQNDPRMPLFVDRQSTTSFGKG